MSEVSATSPAPTSPPTTTSIFSAAFLAGPSPSDLPAGIQLDLFGAEVVRVPRSRRRASEKAPPTVDTSGPICSGSSASACLQQSLEKMLVAALDVNGSPECVQTWKHWDMLSGGPICALRARGRRTSDSAFSGLQIWPTSIVPNGGRTTGRTCPGREGEVRHLEAAARLALWPTTKVSDAERGGSASRADGQRMHLTDYAMLASWGTPTKHDGKGGQQGPREKRTDGEDGARVNRTDTLERQATKLVPTWVRCQCCENYWCNLHWMHAHDCPCPPIEEWGISPYRHLVTGTTSTSFTAPTEKRGVLNPEHSRWLQGFPAAWGFCGATAIASCRRSRQSSSAASSKRKPKEPDRA